MNESSPHPSRLLKAYAACAKWSLWLLLAFWLVLALAWGGLHLLIVPRIGEWRAVLETEAGRALGVPVRIGEISARSEGLVPSVELGNVVLLDPQGREALRVPRVLVALSPRSLWNFGFDQLYIEGLELDVRRAADGRILVAGLDFSSRAEDAPGEAADWFFRQGEVVIRAGAVRWTDERHQAPTLALTEVDLVVRNTARRHAMRLDATPPAGWGERFSLRGLFRQPLLSTHAGRWREWEGQVHADFPQVDVSQLRRHASALPVEVGSGRGALRAWADVSRGQVTGGVADLSLTQVRTTLGAGLEPLALDTVSGRVAAQRLPGGFELETRGLQFTTAQGRHWPGGNLFVSWVDAQGRRSAAGELRADRLDLEALGDVASRLPLGAAAHAALADYAPRGQVESLQARWQGPLETPTTYQLRVRTSGLEVAARTGGPHPRPGLRGAAVELEATEGGGKARLAIRDGALALPGVFEDPVIPLDQLGAELQWKIDGARAAVTVSGLTFRNADAQGEAHGSWRTGDTPQHRFPGTLDLHATLARADGTRVWRYLPMAVDAEVRDYVRQSVLQGRAQDARFRVRGDLREFPFRDKRQGEFRVSAQVRDATYAFAPPGIVGGPLAWPALAQVSGELVFDGFSMHVKAAQGRFSTAPGLRFRASAEIPDLSRSVVAVKAEVRGPLSEAVGVVQQSPLSALLGDALARTTATGPADLRLQLSLPVAQLDNAKVQGSLALAGNDVQFTPDTPMLTRVRGTVSFNERGFAVTGAQARALGGDVRIDGGTRAASAAGEPSLVVMRAQGTASAEGLRQAQELGPLAGLARHASGAAPYDLSLAFRGSRPPEVGIASTLQGMALDLPAPLGKPAAASLPLRYEHTMLRDPQPGAAGQDQVLLELGSLASIQYQRELAEPQARVLRGAIGIGLGPGETMPLPPQGVAANVQLAAIDLDAWERVLEGASAAAPPTAAPAPRPRGTPSPLQAYLPTTMAVRARELTVEGRTLRNIVVGGSREGQVWRANVDADELNGYVEYRQPTGAGAGRVHARLARLSIAAAAASQVESLLDQQPGSMPALDVVVEDFELRGRKLGRLEVEAVNRGAGSVVREGGIREWRLNRLSLTVPEAAFVATGNWAAVHAQATAPGGPRPPPWEPNERRRTVMNFKLDVLDSGGLLARFGMPDVVRRGRGSMEGQVAWIGSPLSLDYPSMTGAFHVNMESGQFLKADPGLAKLLGVLSLQTLPRRLALDFRDVFSQGFAFDFVRGDVTIQEGIAATNNLQMKGVNAAVLMEGKADIARETQDLRVVVIPEINAGTASLVATVINPAIGLGTFLAQMFLREPLARAATQQFQIDGTWTDPRITRISRTAAVAPADTRTAGSGSRGANGE